MEEENNKKYDEMEQDDKSKIINHIKLAKAFFPYINKNSDLVSENCKIKYNQLNTIDKYGLIYFFNEKGIYFIDNSKIQNLFIEKAEISRDKIFFLHSKQQIINVSKSESKDELFLVLHVKNNENESLLEYINIKKMLNKLKDVEEIYHKKEIEDSEEKIEADFKKDDSKFCIVRPVNDIEIRRFIEKGKRSKEYELKKKEIENKYKKQVEKDFNELSKEQKGKIKENEIKKIKEVEKEKELRKLKEEFEKNERLIEEKNKKEDEDIEKKLKLRKKEEEDKIKKEKQERYDSLYKSREDEKNRENKLYEDSYYNNHIIISSEKNFFVGRNIKELIVLNNMGYIVLYENGYIKLYENYNEKKIIHDKNGEYIHYNEKTGYLLIISKDKKIYLINLYPNKKTEKYFEKNFNEILCNYKDEKIIFAESIFNIIAIYTIDNKEEIENDDKLYFIVLKENMSDIKNIYYDESMFYPDEEELLGIGTNNQLNRKIFTFYEEDTGLYYIINKQNNIIQKYFAIKSKENEKIKTVCEVILTENEEIHSRAISSTENLKNYNKDLHNIVNNPFIGFGVIKFKFNGYDNEKIMIGKEYNLPYLIITIGFYGGITLFYLANEQQEYKLQNINEEKFNLANDISNKSMGVDAIDEIFEKEKLNKEAEDQKKKLYQNSSNVNLINKRNIFLRKLDLFINDKKMQLQSYEFEKNIKGNLAYLKKVSEKEEIQNLKRNIDNLYKESINLFESEEEYQNFFDEQKKLISGFKNNIINMKNRICAIENNKDKSRNLINHINLPIRELLTQPKMVVFFGREKIDEMLNLYHKIKNNLVIFENHKDLIRIFLEVNEKFIEDINISKNNYAKIEPKYKVLENRKDSREIISKIQTDIFIDYMKKFENYFYNLEEFCIKNLNKEFNFLKTVKNNLLKQNNDNNLLQNNVLVYNNNIFSNNDINNESINKEEKNDEGINERNNKGKDLIIPYSEIANRNNNNDYYYYLNNLVKIKEPENNNENKLTQILKSFEGRYTQYDEANDDDCLDINDLFNKKYLTNEYEENLKKENKKKKAKKEESEKIKINIEEIFEENLNEKEKIEEGLKELENENNKEKLEKNKQIEELQKKIEEISLQFEKNNEERKKEKEGFKNQDEEKLKELKDLKDQLMKMDELKELNKRLEEEKKKLNEIITQNEQKLEELEKKQKELEDKGNNNIVNNPLPSNFNIKNNNNIININNNVNNNDKKEDKIEIRQNKDKGSAPSIFESNKNENNANNNNSNNIVGDNKKEKEPDNNGKNLVNNLFENPSNKTNSLFTFNMSSNNNVNQNNQNNNNNNNNNNNQNNNEGGKNTTLFQSNNLQNSSIFDVNNNTNQNEKSIFSNSNNNINQNNNNINQNINNTNQNNNNINQNNNKGGLFSGVNIFSNLNINNNNNNNASNNNSNAFNLPMITQNNTNIFGDNKTGFGQHQGIGAFNAGGNRPTGQQITFGSVNTNNNTNNTNANVNSGNSPFGNFQSNVSGGLFSNKNTQNNQNNQNKESSPFGNLLSSGGGLFANFNNQNNQNNENKDSFF